KVACASCVNLSGLAGLPGGCTASLLNTTFFGCTRLHRGISDACTLLSHGAFAPDGGRVADPELVCVLAVVVVGDDVVVVVCVDVVAALVACVVVAVVAVVVGHWHGHVGVGCGVAVGVGLAGGCAGGCVCCAALVKSNVE